MTWLTRTAKDLARPNLVLVERLEGRGGEFWCPDKRELLIDGKYHDLRHGMLLVLEDCESAVLANSIAHEYRHYWQWYNAPHWRATPFHVDRPYKSEILRFFRSRMAMDALLFSHRVAPCWVSEM